MSCRQAELSNKFNLFILYHHDLATKLAYMYVIYLLNEKINVEILEKFGCVHVLEFVLEFI